MEKLDLAASHLGNSFQLIKISLERSRLMNYSYFFGFPHKLEIYSVLVRLIYMNDASDWLILKGGYSPWDCSPEQAAPNTPACGCVIT